MSIRSRHRSGLPNKQLLLSGVVRFKGNPRFVHLVGSLYVQHPAAGQECARSRFAGR
jgi:hypothetical protein